MLHVSLFRRLLRLRLDGNQLLSKLEELGLGVALPAVAVVAAVVMGHESGCGPLPARVYVSVTF